MGNATITFDHVLDYWITFFPEKKGSLKDIEKVIKETIRKDFLELKKKWEQSPKEDKISYLKLVNKVLMMDDDGKISNILESNSVHFEFIDVIKPFINYHISLKMEEILEQKKMMDFANIIKCIFKNINSSLYSVFYKTIILEINLAREESNLKGETAEKRFLYFKDCMLKDKSYLRYLYLDYPYLFNLINKRTLQIINFIISIIKDTKDHYKQLITQFNNKIGLGKIVDITIGQGDTHRGSKSVSFLTFHSKYKLVYKPRSMMLEKNFNRFINWLNSMGIKGYLDLNTARVYSISSCGWMEYIDYEELNNKKDAANYYYRIGELLCLLYIFNSKDFHYENIIANKEHPILIDIETIFHGKVNSDYNDSSAIAKAKKLIDESVCSIYLLPNRISFANDDSGYLDLGGVSGAEEQVASLKSSIIQKDGTDEMKIVRSYGVLSPQKNLPKYQNNIVKSNQYVAEIKKGFSLVYKWIQNNKNLVIQAVYTDFRDAQCRLIIKPTYLYFNLLHSSFHPDLLQDSIHREVFLTRIGMSKYEEKYKYFLSSEYKDLLNGDIPYFYTNVSSLEIKNSHDEVVRGVTLEKSPLTIVENKIEKMSEADFEKQLDFIDLSFLYSEYEGDKALTNISFQTKDLLKRDRTSEMESLIKIGDFILDQAIEGNYHNQKEYTWLGLMIYGKKEQLTQITGFEPDLYKGNSGIALFFAFLYDMTKLQKYKEATIRALNPVITLLKNLMEIKSEETILEIGGFSGISGMVYSLYHSGKYIHKEQFVSTAIQSINLLTTYAKKVEYEDIIGGISGAIAVVLSAFKSNAKEKTQHYLFGALRSLYNRFVEVIKLKGNKGKIDWSKISEGYTGFAHGSSGISAVMMQLYPIIKDPFILKIVTSALDFERELYSGKEKNWHMQVGDEGFSNGWCHGAPGILLNRILLKANGYDDECMEIEIETAIKTTIKNGFGNNSTLCHGDLGSLLILDYAADVMKDLTLKKYCENTFIKIHEDTIKQVILDKNHPDHHLFGLMIGLTGYGYLILKHLKPSINNILWLQ
ncbi:type 2 lanthipeptide synthetase LanM family protein [Bacillus changyiensis]|uniref:type 2 lanthipeptide synthetase LanM family protein n=1 Tax=Bacillus changyiensis TaxID=3004103 RepID=UPI0022E24BAF|nr:type 2 lanthipeptide synthetase LanM family protein [Bacillus changyiensis]MDA1477687.1 type 2 lanthipeptide synthetase LanM family protein [Bacillus changyiensis]